jgi:hypothetical protein
MTRKRAPGPGAPQDHNVWDDLLVIADATAQIAYPSNEAHLLSRVAKRLGLDRAQPVRAPDRSVTEWVAPNRR